MCWIEQILFTQTYTTSHLAFFCKCDRTCWWSIKSLRWSSIMSIEGLGRGSSKSTLVPPYSRLGLGVWGCSYVTLLAHSDGTAVTVCSYQAGMVKHKVYKIHELVLCGCSFNFVFLREPNVNKQREPQLRFDLILLSTMCGRPLTLLPDR